MVRRLGPPAWQRPRATGPHPHYESHDSLLVAAVAGRPGRPDAVIVSAARSASQLATAAELAAGTGSLLVAICSGLTRSDDVAVLAGEYSGLSWLAVDLPPGYRHTLLRLATSAIDEVKVARLGDLSIKRNLGLLLARLCGWSSIMFLDDDIFDVDADGVRTASAMLDTMDMVGLTVDHYPDNSVVCHANRLAGGDQHVFVGGSALLVNCRRRLPFFPEVYNEDWLFLFDSLAATAVARAGRARQLPYSPFADPGRAVAEEFGDVLAEGLVGLLHGPARLAAAYEAAYWRHFLDRRREFIERAMSRLAVLPWLPDRAAAGCALAAAERRRAAITPQSCAAYVRTWRHDRATWDQRLGELSPGTLRRALQQLDLVAGTQFRDPPPPARKGSRMIASEEPPPAAGPAAWPAAGRQVRLHPAAHVAATAQLGVPYRKLLHGEWDRLGRPSAIGANCEIGHFCVVGEEAVIGEGSVLDSFTMVGGGATLGARVIVIHRACVGPKATVGDDCVIGGLVAERSTVGDGCRVFGSLVHRQLDPTRAWDAAESMEGSPVLDDGVFIGWGATVIGGIKIGRGVYVCAGATVTRDVDPGRIVTGINEVLTPEKWKGPLAGSAFFQALG